jgi:hypothetical protein
LELHNCVAPFTRHDKLHEVGAEEKPISWAQPEHFDFFTINFALWSHILSTAGDALSSTCSVSVLQQNHINRTHHPQIVAFAREIHTNKIYFLWSRISIPNQLPCEGRSCLICLLLLISSQTQVIYGLVDRLQNGPMFVPWWTRTHQHNIKDGW